MKRFILGLVSLAISAVGLAADAVPVTYRLDLFHTGGKGVEIFAVDRLRQEPLPWPGHPSRATDDGESGGYRFEVRDADGQLLQARGYASIFGEWVTTDEAQNQHRTFHESLRFPAPAKPGPVQVTIYKRDAQQVLQPLWEAKLDTTDMFVDRSPPVSQNLLAIEQHGAPPDKVDLLLLGDGYTAAECASKFRADAERMTAALFRVQPFARRRQDFNVWGLCPPAADSGVSRPSTGVQHASPVGATYDAFGSERYVLSFENRALREIAAQAPYEALVILANNDTYGGGGIFGLYSTVAVNSSWADYLFVHEFGHHFAALADEYYTSPVAYAPPTTIVEPWEPNVTALLDKDQLKWRHLATTSTAVPTPWPKEAFEAYERDVQAYFRPQLDCIMFTRDQVPFCRVCEAALEQVIDSIAPKTARP
ncbi:MAG: M64 family metallopeptidase [Steroidobacteraceae bacterium]